jgi:hypothetical protein
MMSAAIDYNAINILIVQYMGWDIWLAQKSRPYDLVRLPKQFQTIYGPNNAVPYREIRYDKLAFHKSWEWLMPVIEKIETSTVYTINATYDSDIECIGWRPNIMCIDDKDEICPGLVTLRFNIKIDAMYFAVATYIFHH